MTISELILEFRTTYDLGGSGLPGFEDDDIKIYLDRAQYTFINTVIDQKRVNDLIYLLANDTVASSTTTSGYRLINLPTNYYKLMSVTVEHSEGDEEAIEINYKQLPRFQSSKRNQQAYIKNPVYVLDYNSTDPAIRLYVDSSYVDNPDVKLLYVKEPSDLKVAVSFSEFNLDDYHNIVKIAVDDAIFTVSPNKSQVSTQQLNKIK